MNVSSKQACSFLRLPGAAAALGLLVTTASAVAAEDAPPSFRRDVMPVFFRAGCNGGTCHGSARGKDGFMLSLFGYDPAGDYRRTVEELPGRRVNTSLPWESLLLLKATGSVPHTGGKLFERDSDLYKILHDWIAAGAGRHGDRARGDGDFVAEGERRLQEGRRAGNGTGDGRLLRRLLPGRDPPRPVL